MKIPIFAFGSARPPPSRAHDSSMARKRGRPKKASPRTPSGQLSRMNKVDMEANMSTVLSARMRHHELSTEDAKLPWMESRAGRAIAKEPDAPDLWQEIKEIRRRRKAWLSVIQADEFPKISSVKPASDYTLDIDPAPPSDPRTDVEKAAVAERAWDAVVNALFSVDPLLLRYVEQAIVRDEDVKGPPIAKILRIPSLKEALGC